MENKKTKVLLLETAQRIQELLEILVVHKENAPVRKEVDLSIEDGPVPSKRKTVHISDLVLAEGDWLMDTVEACAEMGISRGTLVSHRDEGLLTEVRIGKKGGGVRFISSEVAGLREWYSVRKGKV